MMGFVQRHPMKILIACVIGFITVVFSIYGLVAYVAVHFIAKFW